MVSRCSCFKIRFNNSNNKKQMENVRNEMKRNGSEWKGKARLDKNRQIKWWTGKGMRSRKAKETKAKSPAMECSVPSVFNPAHIHKSMCRRIFGISCKYFYLRVFVSLSHWMCAWMCVRTYVFEFLCSICAHGMSWQINIMKMDPKKRQKSPNLTTSL